MVENVLAMPRGGGGSINRFDKEGKVRKVSPHLVGEEQRAVDLPYSNFLAPSP